MENLTISDVGIIVALIAQTMAIGVYAGRMTTRVTGVEKGILEIAALNKLVAELKLSDASKITHDEAIKKFADQKLVDEKFNNVQKEIKNLEQNQDKLQRSIESKLTGLTADVKEIFGYLRDALPCKNIKSCNI